VSQPHPAKWLALADSPVTGASDGRAVPARSRSIHPIEGFSTTSQVHSILGAVTLAWLVVVVGFVVGVVEEEEGGVGERIL